MIRRESKEIKMTRDDAINILLEHFSEGMVRTIVDALIEDEREACAKICDAYENGRYSNAADLCAESIRARGQE